MRDVRGEPARWGISTMLFWLAACGGAAEKSAEVAPSAPLAQDAPESAAPASPKVLDLGPPRKPKPKSRGITLDDGEDGDMDEADGKRPVPLGSLDDAEEEMEEAITLIDQSMGGGASALSAGSGRCATACKAIGSMRRAVGKICKLDDGGARCTAARAKLSENEARVAATACGC